jgi:hypothetical protein
VRENRSHGSEGGEAQTFPTPIGSWQDACRSPWVAGSSPATNEKVWLTFESESTSPADAMGGETETTLAAQNRPEKSADVDPFRSSKNRAFGTAGPAGGDGGAQLR